VDIKPKEVESVKIIGNLYDSDVKLVKTMGGFYLAIGKKKKNSRKSEALAAGSHQAIVAHQLSKEYGSDFQPAVFKSEQDQIEQVEDKSSYLPRTSIEKGVELYTLSKSNKIEFVLCRRGITIGKYDTEAKDKTLIIKNNYFNSEVEADRQTAEALSKAMKDKAYELGLSEIKKA